jgi:hypothetical protein
MERPAMELRPAAAAELVLYQGMTSVVPNAGATTKGFSPCSNSDDEGMDEFAGN